MTASLGDTVWFDSNGNGVQDGGEAGVAGVSVNLLDANGAVLKTVTTDANGKYQFTGLVPGVPYSVEFVKTSLPAGYQFTLVGAGSDSSDSNADPVTGKTKTYVLVAGENNPTVDAGIVKPVVPSTTVAVVPTAPAPTTPAPTTMAVVPVVLVNGTGSIGDRVWLDRNGDGKQDPKERGIHGAIVVLTMPDGSTREAVTDEQGYYRFEGLPEGTYKVEILSSTTPTNGPKARAVALAQAENYDGADFGFTNVGIKGVEISQSIGLALTGSSSLMMATTSLFFVALGGQLMFLGNRKKRKLNTAKH